MNLFTLFTLNPDGADGVCFVQKKKSDPSTTKTPTSTARFTGLKVHMQSEITKPAENLPACSDNGYQLLAYIWSL